MNSSLDEQDNPYRAPATAFEPATESRRRGSWVLRTILIQSTVMLIGVPVAWYWIESIIFSGVIFTISGVFVAVQSWRHSNSLGQLFGLSAPLLSLALFTLINVNEWSPGEAYYPVNQILAMYAGIALPVAAVAARSQLNVPPIPFEETATPQL